MSNELQKDDFLLPGDLGSVVIDGVNQKVTKVVKGNGGMTTVTINANPNRIIITSQPADRRNDIGNGWTNGFKNFAQAWQDTEDADFEIVQQKQLPDGERINS